MHLLRICVNFKATKYSIQLFKKKKQKTNRNESFYFTHNLPDIENRINNRKTRQMK